MGLIKEEDRKAIREAFANGLKGDVNLAVFYGRDGCQYCSETIEILDTLSSIDRRIKVTKYDIKASAKEAKFMGIDKVPAIAISGAKMYNVHYYGIPAGYEFSSLMEDIIDASRGETGLTEAVKASIRKVNRPVDIKVFVTPTCPYCPKAVRIAHQFAMENRMITGSMIEAQEFMELSQKYGVMGVPKVVINDTVSFEGAYPEEEFARYVTNAAKG